MRVKIAIVLLGFFSFGSVMLMLVVMMLMVSAGGFRKRKKGVEN
jgi:uncharacterized membrane protein